MKSARSNGDERLVDVESRAHRIEIGMREGQHARAAPRNPEQQRSQRWSGGGDGEGQVLPVHAREDKHHRADSGEHQRGAEVGLLHNQQHEHDRHNGGAQQRVAPVLHLVKPRGQKPAPETE